MVTEPTHMPLTHNHAAAYNVYVYKLQVRVYNTDAMYPIPRKAWNKPRTTAMRIGLYLR